MSAAREEGIIREALDALPEGTAVMICAGDGTPENVAFRAMDVDNELSWALAGKPAPFTTRRLARTFVAQGLSWRELT